MKLSSYLKTIYRQLFPDYIIELKKVIADSKTLLDVGCGSNSPIQYLSQQTNAVGIDSFEPSLKQSMVKKIHDRYILDNVLNIKNHFSPSSFETVVALDLIEHLEKKTATKLISDMEEIASKKVVIFTPNGFLSQGEFDNNPCQVHLSGWSVKDFKERGYKVVGINGLRLFRREFAEIRFKPKILWQFISDLSQLFVRSHPEWAFQLLAVKDIYRLKQVDTSEEKKNLKDPKTLFSNLQGPTKADHL